MEMGADRGKKGERGGREIIPLTGLQGRIFFFNFLVWSETKLSETVDKLI